MWVMYPVPLALTSSGLLLQEELVAPKRERSPSFNFVMRTSFFSFKSAKWNVCEAVVFLHGALRSALTCHTRISRESKSACVPFDGCHRITQGLQDMIESTK